jgi:hypothetical protein
VVSLVCAGGGASWASTIPAVSSEARIILFIRFVFLRLLDVRFCR